jgi:glycosyltransferase involved in cell wall biosynthesis
MIYSLATYGLLRFNLCSGLVVNIWDRYDQWVARQIAYSNNANIFHGWSSFCLQSLEKAKAMGMVTVVERSGPHILTERRILEEEKELLGIKEDFDAQPYFQRADRMIEEYQIADYILTCSSYARESFLKEGFEAKRVISIPLGSNFSPKAVERSLASPFRVLCVGTHPYFKGVFYLIKAWQRARLTGAELRLRVPLTRRIAEEIKDPSIRILPPLNHAKLADEYRQATVFCLPSINDGFGMVVLEAMSFGLPVIVSTHVGAAEIVRPGVDGLIFPVRDIDALTECLVTLYRDRERAQWMGMNALERSQEYTWERYGTELIRFYSLAIEK